MDSGWAATGGTVCFRFSSNRTTNTKGVGETFVLQVPPILSVQVGIEEEKKENKRVFFFKVDCHDGN